MRSGVNCESNSSTTVQSNYYWKGKREESFGLVQINLPSNSDVSYHQATDPDFSLDFLASHLASGQGYLWACFREHNGYATTSLSPRFPKIIFFV